MLRHSCRWFCRQWWRHDSLVIMLDYWCHWVCLLLTKLTTISAWLHMRKILLVCCFSCANVSTSFAIQRRKIPVHVYRHTFSSICNEKRLVKSFYSDPKWPVTRDLWVCPQALAPTKPALGNSCGTWRLMSVHLQSPSQPWLMVWPSLWASTPTLTSSCCACPIISVSSGGGAWTLSHHAWPLQHDARVLRGFLVDDSEGNELKNFW
jgi:hypothetical protein